ARRPAPFPGRDARKRIQLHRGRRARHVQHPFAWIRPRQPGAYGAVRATDQRSGALSHARVVGTLLSTRSIPARTPRPGVSVPDDTRGRTAAGRVGWIGLGCALDERRGAARSVRRVHRYLNTGFPLGVIRDVAGIALAPDGKQLLLTGKYWPVMLQVRLRSSPSQE